MNAPAVILAALLTISGTQIPDTSPKAAPASVFLVHDDPHKEWCAFTSESSWRSRVDSSEATTVGTLNYSDSRLISIDVTTDDEAGDWTVFDHYTVTKTGSLERLDRRANILPGRRSALETYALVDGKARLQSRETKDLTSGEKLTSGETWLPKVRIALRLTDFQFAPLAQTKYSEILSKGKVCAATRSGAP